MAPMMSIASLQTRYADVLGWVLKRSVENAPRGHKVHDAGFSILEITRPDLPQLPVDTGRGVNLDIAAIEAIQLISGQDRSDLVLKIAPQFVKYTNPVDGSRRSNEYDRYFHGNYGARMRTSMGHSCDQEEYHHSWLQCAVRKIKNDIDTRQAVITLWDNVYDNGKLGMNDYPCTIALTFRMYRGQLDMTTHMRSNDAWIGLPYDVFQFNQAHHTVANMLSAPMGTYRHITESMHIYDEHRDLVKKVRNKNEVSPTKLPRGFTHVDNAIYVLGRYGSQEDDVASHRWYRERLAPYMKETSDE
jgi:thymidylate synthase